MDLNVAVSTASELFEDNDMVFPILMGRENLKILASPGSESSGVSSLDAEEAKVIIYSMTHFWISKKLVRQTILRKKNLTDLLAALHFISVIYVI